MLENINAILSGIAVPVLLTLVGVFYGFKLKFFHILKPRTVIRTLCSSQTGGGISSAKALSLALAGTLGVGNIVGVSSAISLGGFGAVFWMWISALVAMLLKYAEIVLAIRHRDVDSHGMAHGSAMSYIVAFFRSRAMEKLGRVLARIFAALFLLNALTMGSMLQSGAIADAAHGVTGLPKAYVGMVIAVITFFVIRSGTKAMAGLTSVLVPLMSFGFIVLSLAVIFANRNDVPNAFRLIITSAFSTRSLGYGVGAYTFLRALRYGFMRGLISNEAGCGTAPTAHAIADCRSCAHQGVWGIFEVFVDTILLCTLTALCIILEYDAARVFDGNFMMMTLAAYSEHLGRYAEYFLLCAVLCFGLATIICWAHYGMSALEHFTQTRRSKKLFAVIYCGAVLAGAVITPTLAWELADFAMATMTLINLTILALSWKSVKEESRIFLFP